MQVTAHVKVTWECPNCKATNEAELFNWTVECCGCGEEYELRFEG